MIAVKGFACWQKCASVDDEAVIDIDGIGEGDAFTRLWRSLGRIVVSVEIEHELAFVEMMEGADIHLIGMVTESSELIVEDGYDAIIKQMLTNLLPLGKRRWI